MTNARALRLRGRIVRRARPCGDGAPWEIWAAGASSPAGGSSLSGHPAAAVPAGDDGRGISALCLFQPGPGGNQRDTLDSPWGFWSPPLHIMGFCGRPGGDPNAWKHSGSGQTRAVEPCIKRRLPPTALHPVSPPGSEVLCKSRHPRSFPCGLQATAWHLLPLQPLSHRPRMRPGHCHAD
jgi:hypothetical protein